MGIEIVIILAHKQQVIAIRCKIHTVTIMVIVSLKVASVAIVPTNG